MLYRVSKNGISSSCLNSMVNLILLWLFKCCKNSGHSDVKQYVKVPSRRRNQTKGEGQTLPFMAPLVLLNLRKVLRTGIQPVFRTMFDRSYAYFSHVFIVVVRWVFQNFPAFKSCFTPYPVLIGRIVIFQVKGESFFT